MSESLLSGIASLRDNDAFTDLEIVCDGKVFSVHKFVVCSQSPVLKRMCEERHKATTTTVIEAETYDAATVGRMLHFMYRGYYEVDSPLDDESDFGSEPVGIHEIAAHVHCHAIAESYRIAAMSNDALAMFKHLSRYLHPSDVADTVQLVASSSASNALKFTLRDEVLGRIHVLAKDPHFIGTLASPETAMVSSLCANLLRSTAEKHEGTIDHSRKLEETIQRHGETIQSLQAQVSRDMTTLRRGEEAHNEAAKAIGEWRARAEKAEAALAKAKADAPSMHAADALVHRLAAEKEAARAAAQRAQEGLNRALQDIGALKLQLQQAAGEAARRAVPDFQQPGDAVVANAKLTVTEKKLTESERLSEERRYNMERAFQLVNRLHYCQRCDAGFASKLQKGMPCGNKNAADTKMALKCRQCHFVHTVEEFG